MLIRIIIEYKDAIKQLKQTTDELNKLKDTTEQVDKKISGMDNFTNWASSVSTNIDKVAQKFSNLGTTLMIAGGGLTATITRPLVNFGNDAVDIALDVEKEWVRMAKATGDEIDVLKEKLTDTSRVVTDTYGTSMAENIGVMTEFQKSGIATEDTLDDLLKTSAEVSMMFDVELPNATKAVISTMQRWGLDIDDTRIALSKINEVADATAASEDKMLESFAKASPVLQTYGGSIEFLNASLAALASRGFQGSEAGTAFANIIQYVSQDIPKLTKTLNELGVEVDASTLSTMNAEDKMLLLAEAYSRTVNESKLSADEIEKWATAVDESGGATVSTNEKLNDMSTNLSELIRKRQFPKLVAWLEDYRASTDNSIDTISNFERAMEAQGKSAEELAGIWEGKVGLAVESLPNKIEILQQKWNDIKVVVGNLIIEQLIPLADNLGELIDKFTNLPKETQDFIVKLGMVAAAVGPILLVLGSLSSSIGAIGKVFGEMFTTITGILGKVGTAVGGSTATLGTALTTIAGPIALIGAAIAGVIGWVVEIGKRFKTDFIDKISPETIANITSAIDSFKQGFQNAIDKINEFKDSEFVTTILDSFSDSFSRLAEKINEMTPEDWQKIADAMKIAGTVIGGIIVVIVGLIAVLGTLIILPGLLAAVIGNFFAENADNLKNFGPVLKENLTMMWENISTFFTDIWTKVSTFFTDAWTTLKENLAMIWDNISTFFSDIWTKITTFFSDTWNSIVEFFTNIWTTLVEKVELIIGIFVYLYNTIKDNIRKFVVDIVMKWIELKDDIVEKVKELVSNVVDWFVNMYDSITDKVENIKTTLSEKWQDIKDTIKGLVDGAVDWGRDMIQNFINGIQEKYWALINSVSNLAAEVKAFLGFSLPDKGPLSDADKYMPDFIRLMSSTLDRAAPELYAKVKDVANGIQSSLAPAFNYNASVSGLQGVQDQINSQLTVPVSASMPQQNIKQIHEHYEVKPGVMIASDAEQREFLRHIEKLKEMETVRTETQ